MSRPERDYGRSRAIVWDLDGTLIDSAPDLAAALNTLLDRRGFNGHSVRQVRAMVGDGVEKLVERGFEAAGMSQLPAATATLAGEFMEIYSQSATERTRPYPLIRQTLRQLERAGFHQGICTNKPEEVTRKITADLGLDRHLKFIIGGDSTPAKKPDPRPLVACLEGLGANPAYSIMIGDSAVDVQTARELHVPVGVVSWGYSRIPVQLLGADFIIRHPQDLPNLVQTVGRQQDQKAGTA